MYLFQSDIAYISYDISVLLVGKTTLCLNGVLLKK